MDEKRVFERLTLARIRLLPAVIVALVLIAVARVTDAAAQGTGAIEGTVQVRGREGMTTGGYPLLIVPISEANRIVSEAEFTASAIRTDDRGNFKKEGLAPGTYLVGVLLAPQVLEGSFDGSIKVAWTSWTLGSAEPILLPAREVEVAEGKTAHVEFVRKPYPTPVPGLRVPHTGEASLEMGAASDAGSEVEMSAAGDSGIAEGPGTAAQGGEATAPRGGFERDWLLVGGAALMQLALGAGGAGAVRLRRHPHDSH